MLHRKKIAWIVISLLLGMLVNWAGNVQVARAAGSIYIKADGSIDPPTAPISTTDNTTYYLIDNIIDQQVTIQRSNIVINGKGFQLDGSASPSITGFYLVSVTNVTIQNTTLKKFTNSVTISAASHIVVTKNTIQSSSRGVEILSGSALNVISGNTFQFADVWLMNSNRNIFANNTINGGGDIVGPEGALHFVTSSNNSISGNTMSCAVPVVLSSSSNNRFSGNAISGFAFGFYLIASNDNLFSGNAVTGHGGEAFLFDSCSGNTVFENSIRDSGLEGINLLSSSNNTIYGNVLENNLIGVAIYGSSNNRIFHNHFRNNVVYQALGDSGFLNFWDDGYPSGGNYWSDYSGTDIYKGPYQNETGSDGIGDTPRPIISDNPDRYPFTAPMHDIAVIDVHHMKTGCLPRPTVCQNMTMKIYVTVENQGFFLETFNVTAYANSNIVGQFTATLSFWQNLTFEFTWNTTGLIEYSNCTISANVTRVLDETDLADNVLVDENVTITHMGDITGDGKVETSDVARVSGAFGTVRVSDPQDPHYNQYWHPIACAYCPHSPNADVNGDGKVDISDLARTSNQFGWHQ